MPPVLDFRLSRPDDKAAIVSLLAQGRAPAFASLKSALFDWQFVRNPASSAEAPFLLATDGDAIVGSIATTPVHLTMQGQERTGAWMVDFYVAHAHRGHGLGTSLIQQASRRAPIVLAFGISDLGNPLFERLGWPLDDSLATMFQHCAETGLQGQVKNLASRALRLAGAGAVRRPDLEIATEAGVCPSEVDGVWRRVASQYGNAVRRDGAYLRWRYADSPVHAYRWLAARRGDELRALMITRHHGVESVIADYLGPLDDPGLLAAMCGQATADLASSGTRRVRCETTHPAVKRALARAGFRTYRSTGRFRLHTDLPAHSAPPGSWFIMTGDSDNDMLPT